MRCANEDFVLPCSCSSALGSLDMKSFPKEVPERLDAEEMTALRIARFLLDGGRCTKCGCRVFLDYPDWHPLKADLAHLKGRGANGSDTLENTRTLCHRDHMKFHNGDKPCPSKHGGINEPNSVAKETLSRHESR